MHGDNASSFARPSNNVHPQLILPQNAIQQRQVESPQSQGQPLPDALGFTRVARDGTPIRAFDPRTDFSPSVSTKSNGIDHTKSTPIPRTKVQKGPFNISDAPNRMAHGPPGFNQNNRVVGCPPNRPFSPHKLESHIRANSGPVLAGGKRNFQGQCIR